MSNRKPVAVAVVAAAVIGVVLGAAAVLGLVGVWTPHRGDPAVTYPLLSGR